MRVSETCRVDASHFDWRAASPTLTIHPSKGRHGPRVPDPVRTTLHPQAVPFGRTLCGLQERYPALLSVKPTAPALNAWLHQRLRRTRDAGATWHSFRRGCATLLRAGFIARRKFGLPAARVARVLARLFDWDDESDDSSPSPPTQARRLLFATEAPWKPLKGVGSCRITLEELRAAFDPHRPPPPPPSRLLPRPSPSPLSQPVRDFLRDMLSQGLVEEVDPLRNPTTCRVSIIAKNDSKSRAICNARWLNQRQPHPPAHFKLPSVHQLKELLLAGPLFFCTLDRGRVRGFRFLHLPFGWNASPVVCQRRTSAAILPPVGVHLGAWALVYLDDALVFARAAALSERAAAAAAQGLRDDDL
eukprot:gene26022-21038_t